MCLHIIMLENTPIPNPKPQTLNKPFLSIEALDVAPPEVNDLEGHVWQREDGLSGCLKIASLGLLKFLIECASYFVGCRSFRALSVAVEGFALRCRHQGCWREGLIWIFFSSLNSPPQGLNP